MTLVPLDSLALGSTFTVLPGEYLPATRLDDEDRVVFTVPAGKTFRVTQEPTPPNEVLDGVLQAEDEYGILWEIAVPVDCLVSC